MTWGNAVVLADHDANRTPTVAGRRIVLPPRGARLRRGGGQAGGTGPPAAGRGVSPGGQAASTLASGVATHDRTEVGGAKTLVNAPISPSGGTRDCMGEGS